MPTIDKRGPRAAWTALGRGLWVVAAVAARSSEPELAAQWGTLMDRWVDATAAAIEAERDRGAAIAGPPPRSLATALNLLNERVIVAELTGPRRPGAGRDIVDTLLHVWLSSIYGGAPPLR